MKKRKILYLFPLAALILSGCTIPDAYNAAKDWTGQNIYFPIRDFINKLLGKETPDQKGKDEKPSEDQKPSGGDQGGGDQGGSGDQGGGGETQPSKYGSLEHPLSVSEAIALIDKEGTTAEDIYITGTVATNQAYASKYGQLDVVLAEGDQWLKVFRASTFPDDFDAEKATYNSMKGMTVVASGSGTTYNETYELDADCTIHSVTGEAVKPEAVTNYGTAEHPLTVSEAIDVIDKQDPTLSPIFVTGTVTKNGAWNTSNKNVDIYISDGAKELQLFRVTKLPDDVATNSLVADSLKGKTVTATGTGMFYFEGKVYELAQGGEVLSVVTPHVDVTGVEVQAADELIVGYTTNLTAKVLPENASQEVVWSIAEGGDYAELTGEDNSTLRGVAPGKVTVRATAKGTEVYGEKEITVVAPSKVYVQSITTDPVAVEMTMGDEAFALTANISPENVEEEVTWTVKEGYEDIIELDNDNKIVAKAAGKAEIRIEGAESHIGVDVKVSVYAAHSSIEDVYKAAIALGAGNSSTGEYTFKGVVTAIQGKSFYLQENGYGMLVYNYELAGVEVGKVVQVTSKIQNYSGLAETKGTPTGGIVFWDGEMPTPIEVTGTASIGEANILANAANAVFKSRSANWSGSVAGLGVFTIGSDDITVKFDKYGFDDDKGALFNNALAGDIFDLGNIVTAINGTAKQLGFAATSTITQHVIAPTSVSITSANEVKMGETLKLAATVQPEGAVHDLVWGFEEGGTGAGTIAGNVLTPTLEGTVNVKVYVKGYESVSDTMTVTITEAAPTVQYYDATMAKGDTYSYDDVTINGESAIKMGKSNYAGNMTITVPANATGLRFYAVAWNGKGGSDFPVTLSGATMNPNTFNPVANTNIAGNAKAFTIEDVTDYLVEIELSNVTQETVITLTSTERVIVWGAQYKLA